MANDGADLTTRAANATVFHPVTEIIAAVWALGTPGLWREFSRIEKDYGPGV